MMLPALITALFLGFWLTVGTAFGNAPLVQILAPPEGAKLRDGHSFLPAAMNASTAKVPQRTQPRRVDDRETAPQAEPDSR